MPRLPAHVTDFHSLIRWLIETYHDGVVYGLAKRMHISPATADHWSRGLTKSPTIHSLARICDVYKLNLAEVIRVASKRIAVLAAVLSTAGVLSLTWNHAAGGAPITSQDSSTNPTSYTRHYVNLRQRVRRWLVKIWPPLHTSGSTFLAA